MTSEVVIDCKNTAQCANLIRKATNKKFVALFFYVDFHEPSKLGGEMDKLYTKLASETPEGSFLRIDADADETEDIAEMLIEEGADVNKVDINGNNALHWALARGHFRVADRLIKYRPELLELEDSKWRLPICTMISHMREMER